MDNHSMVGRSLLIDRIGKRGKQFGYHVAMIKSEDNGKYTCTYKDWPEIEEIVEKAELFDPNCKRVVLMK